MCPYVSLPFPALLCHSNTPQVNTSTLGYTAVNATSTSSSAVPSPTSLRSWLASVAQKLTAEAKNEIQEDIIDIQNGVATNLSQTLGFQQWYSLHMLDLCYGTFSPNATAPDANHDVTACTPRTVMCK